MKIDRDIKDLIFNGKLHRRAYFNGKLIWQKTFKINVDHKTDRSGVIEGSYDEEKGGFLI